MLSSILNPVFALIVWTMLIWSLMYLRRIPAMQKAGIAPQSAKHPGSLAVLPSRARAAADNYNHLHEQPTVFYALAFYLHLTAGADIMAIILAWGYVGLRVVHSVVQTTVNLVVVRFSLFALSSLILIGLIIKAFLALGLAY